jgi:diguanylate cyclase (GGDEF)-like protein
MNIFAAVVYWVIVLIWISIFSTVVWFYFTNRKAFGTTKLLLAVLGLDALRNIIENIYFGLYFGSKYGLFKPHVALILGEPHLLILPKLGNIAAGCIVMGLLLMRWLPEAIRERAETERQTAHLHELATTDSMTGLWNRGQFFALAEIEWQQSRRYRHPLSLLILDVDHFKSINDRYGHDAGDRILIKVANGCAVNKRKADIAGRLGGEEFGILMMQTGLHEAQLFAERLCQAIAADVTLMPDGELTTTVSIGVTSAADAFSVEEFFKLADNAMYDAKRSGRNRVRSYARG